MTDQLTINTRYATESIKATYAHVGLYDVQLHRFWIAKRRRWGTRADRVSHASLLLKGTHDTSAADKDRFICTWFHTPGSGQGHIHGYPIEWDEGHLMIRMDPQWNYLNRQLIPTTETARVEHNIDQQYDWGKKLFKVYIELKPAFPISWHMIGPRAKDSMFYIERIEQAKR